MKGIKIHEAQEDEIIGEYGFVRIGDENYILNNKPLVEETDTGKYKIYGFEKLPALYLCDPEKNIKCKKTGCQTFCKHTSIKEFAKGGNQENA